MKGGPDLADGETLLHHHKPHLGAFKRTALLMIAITLVPTFVMMFAFPDTIWVAVPMFVTCFLLMQERFSLGKYAAWITNRRIILQRGEEIALTDIASVDMIGNAVRLRPADRSPKIKLFYAKDKAALRDLIEQARGDVA